MEPWATPHLTSARFELQPFNETKLLSVTEIRSKPFV